MILDTSILVDLLRGNITTRNYVAELETKHILSISSITVFELETYIPAQKMNILLRRVNILPIGEDIARRGGSICKELIESGKEIDSEDCLIAATALLNDEPLLTKNTSHFSRIFGLNLVSAYY